MKIECYKGIDNRVFMFGFNPVDFLVALFSLLPAMLAFFLVQSFFGLIASVAFAAGYLVCVLLGGRSDLVLNRPRGIHSYIVTYLSVPERLAVPSRGELAHDKH